MSEQLIQASRDVHLFLSYTISPSAAPGPCVGATIWPHGPHMAPSHRETLKNIKSLPYTFMAASSHSPICPPDGFCTSIRLSYMNLCYEALPSWPRCPHLSVTRDVQYFKNLVHLVFKLEQTIWIYVFYIFKTYQQPHMVTLSLKFQRATPLSHKIFSYPHINHFLQNWFFHFHEILLWWEE